jgi:hypothetical protein
MSVITIPVNPHPSSSVESPAGPVSKYFSALLEITAPDVTSAVGVGIAVSLLVALWAFQMYSTWATWGNLSIDCGREAYVPAMLAQGKTLYRDVWYVYGPAAPYFNSSLFRLFGVHLSVLYWAGSLSALACALLLYLAGKQVSSPLAGWTAGAVVLFQSFQSWLFCFPFPYSFASVYGCLAACAFLCLLIRASTTAHWGWVLGSGTAAAAALLLKLEFGMACYATLFLMIVAHRARQWSWKLLTRDLLWLLPGLAFCGLVVLWMVSLRGAAFITQENLMSWPTSFFMKAYGKAWLERSGLAFTTGGLRDAIYRAFFFAGVALEAYSLLWWKRPDRRSIILRAGLFLALLTYCGVALQWKPMDILRAVFFPRDMVFYAGIAAVGAWWYFWRHSTSDRALALAALLTFSALLAFRILLRMTPWGYPIYYNGPVVFCFYLLVRPLIPRFRFSPRMVFRAELMICLGSLFFVANQSRLLNEDPLFPELLTTGRGTIRVRADIAENYKAAIRFMQEKAVLGEYVLSVPEDTSLYFLSGTPSPTRVFAFTPGTVAPGKMTNELIQEIDRKPVRYLLWSNRTFVEYGVPIFGVDFDQTLGDYLKSHYRRVGPLIPPTNQGWEMTMIVWERNPEPARP